MFFSRTTAPPETISIGITTFAHRFEEYFMPLVSRIRKYDEDSEIIVAVNGEHEAEFDEMYRTGILEFLAAHPKIYPVFFPRFRGLSKLWNTIVIHATHDHILMLNDDIMIDNRDFMEKIRKCLRRNEGRSFVINQSWSHFILSRDEIDELGYFDERLLGIGEEDGDFTWRYMQRYGRKIPSFKIKGIANFAEETVYTYKPPNIQCHSGTKYSLFNREFILNRKYRRSEEGLKGMFDNPVIMNDEGSEQYPHERFYRRHKKKL